MKFVAVIVYTPIFFIPGIIVGALGAWIGQIYIASQLPVKQWMSISIRAFGAESKFGTESLARVDGYTRAACNYHNLTRWVGIRADLLGSTFSAALAAYLVYIKGSSAGDTGFLFNMPMTFTR
ncbi:hypothetical protein DFH09DRAFT_901328 [Mycena vulgaris]|nr:hypothetical protein DFH09DRAFT_901328 [Mycena vulgaris]